MFWMLFTEKQTNGVEMGGGPEQARYPMPTYGLTREQEGRCAGRREVCPLPHGGRHARRARAVHKGCAGPYRRCIVVPSASNNEPCYAFMSCLHA